MAKIIGLGGIFFKAKNPQQLAAWYKKYLGLNTLEWSGAIFMPEENKNSNACNIWALHDEKTDYFAPSTKNFMVNFIVDDIEKLVENLKAQNLEIGDIQSHEQGKFSWIIDPENNKVELWEPLKD